jgi:hypothetical protein
MRLAICKAILGASERDKSSTSFEQCTRNLVAHSNKSSNTSVIQKMMNSNMKDYDPFSGTKNALLNGQTIIQKYAQFIIHYFAPFPLASFSPNSLT